MPGAVEHKRRLPGVAWSVAVHGALLAYVTLAGLAFKARVNPAISFERITQVEIAGGSHRIPIPLPKAQYAAHTREPVPAAEAVLRLICPLTRVRPLE